MMYVCRSVCVCASLAPERLEGFCFCSVCKSLSTKDQCPVNVNILALRVRALHRSLQAQNCDLLDGGRNESDSCSVIYGNNLS
jgi:hypothetical protein